MWPHSVVLLFARTDLATAAPNAQRSAQTRRQSQWHHPLGRVVTAGKVLTLSPVCPKGAEVGLDRNGTCFRPGLAGPQGSVSGPQCLVHDTDSRLAAR